MADGLTLAVKFGPKDVDVVVAADTTVAGLQAVLEQDSRVNVMVRKQKVIFKGKVLSGQQKLVDCGVSNGSKLMLLVAEGVQTQGQAAVAVQKQERQQEAAERVKQLYAQAKGGLPAPAATAPSAVQPPQPARVDWAERQRNWHKTGIIVIRELGLSTVPEDVLAGLPNAKVADLSRNALTSLPASLASLISLQTLKAASNQLHDVTWGAVAQLTALRVLSLEDNRLAAISPDIAALVNLQQLNLSNNQLSGLPVALAALTQLEMLNSDGNQLTELPAALGSCCSLMELSVERNQIGALPLELSQLQKLQTLKADRNRIKAVPPCILQGCGSLAILSLQDNPITADQLRSTPGFAEYDARRVAKCNKQLDMSVLPQTSRAFTEGADQQQWARWADNEAKKR